MHNCLCFLKCIDKVRQNVVTQGIVSKYQTSNILVCGEDLTKLCNEVNADVKIREV